MRRELVLGLEELNFDVEVSHHEVGPGQHEIDFKFDHALKTADAVITFKQAIKAIADKLGSMVTFMPNHSSGCTKRNALPPELLKMVKMCSLTRNRNQLSEKLCTSLEVYSHSKD
jgi:hypothetical protein